MRNFICAELGSPLTADKAVNMAQLRQQVVALSHGNEAARHEADADAAAREPSSMSSAWHTAEPQTGS